MIFAKNVNISTQNIIANALSGKFPVFIETNLVEDGVSVFLGENKFDTNKEQVRKVSTQAPSASILIKKKAFSTFKAQNDLRWLDQTERLLLRATKALFAFKVAQIRTYESMSKFEDYFKSYQQINLKLLVDLINNSKYFDIINADAGLKSEQAIQLLRGALNNALSYLKDEIKDNQNLKEDVYRILQRTAFSGEVGLTTWFVDPLDMDNYGTGPGTGVIELGLYSSFSCSSSVSMEPSAASFSFQDPYRISYVSEEDVEIAIEEALFGSLNLFEDLTYGFGSAQKVYTNDASAAIQLLGLGNLDSTINISYIRQQLRKFYLGKSIINCGDGVHIYIRGNRFHANYQPASNDSGVKEGVTFDDYFIDENILKAEWVLYTERKISYETYKKLRLSSEESFAMQHVYGGFITSVNESYSTNSGWSTRVSTTNNMGWLEWSRYMSEPGLQNSKGVLEDPLTPYEIKTDETGEVITERLTLLPENQYLLQQGLLRFDSGIFKGQAANQSNIIQGQYSGTGSLYGSKIVQHADGFVYRWKTGIITATAGMAPGSNPNRNQENAKALAQTFGITSAQDVLMNLDVANIISLLVVGQPYNLQAFLEQAYEAQTLSGKDGSTNFQGALVDIMSYIRKQNNYFGGFKPYRLITMSSVASQQGSDYTLQNDKRKQANNKISALRARAAKLLDSIAKLKTNQTSNINLIKTLQEEVSIINQSISNEVNLISTSSSLDPIVANFNLFGQNKIAPYSGFEELDFEVSRAMSIIGAQRRIEDVRLNRDQNLLIVSDQYDQDTDIRPFLKALRDSNWKIFKGTYLDVFTKCKAAVSTANFEFFCNTQGHLELRPPLWNRTPLSVLRAMMELEKHNKNIVPPFLKNMFQTRISSIKREIHRENVRIALLSLMMRKYPDRSLIPNMKVSGKESLNFFGLNLTEIYVNENGDPDGVGANLKRGFGGWVDSWATSAKTNPLSLYVTGNSSGDILSGNTDTIIGEFDPVFQQSINIITFTEDGLVVNGIANSPVRGIKASDIDDVRKNFKKSFGADPLYGEFFESLTESKLLSTNLDSNQERLTNVEGLFEKLKASISKRDGLVYALKRNEEKQRELMEVETLVSTLELQQETIDRQAQQNNSQERTPIEVIQDALTTTANVAKSFSDILSGSANQGSVIDHLIENDERNILGPGSGKRYIIREEDIISVEFSERPPDFCRVDVVGTAPFVDPGGVTEDLYYWAGATDFDLWRQYGYKSKSPDKLPYSSDAELQSKPFALMELQTQKVQINQGSITVIGNEYYQPGDTVYVSEKGMLYYVKSVSHNFTFGSEFRTTLELSFGHVPGEYIPTPMDIIGQQYGFDPLGSTFLTYKGDMSDSKYQPLQPESNILFPNQEITQDNIDVLLSYVNNQVRLTTMISSLPSVITGQRYVVIRGFYKTDEEEDAVMQRAEIVQSLLVNPVQVSRLNFSNTNIDSLTDADQYISDLIQGSKISIRNFGRLMADATLGNAKQTAPMILPNGSPASGIRTDQIIIQLTRLGSDSPSYKIKCLDSRLQSKILKNGIMSEGMDSKRIAEQLGLNEGGPKQSSWLDLRSDITAINRIIEVGVIDLPSV